jgi:hypothetical protein
LEERKYLTLLGLELRTLLRPARSQSLYRLRYTAIFIMYFDRKVSFHYTTVTFPFILKFLNYIFR